MDPSGSQEIAKRSGDAAVANVYCAGSEILPRFGRRQGGSAGCGSSLRLLEVDELGLDKMDRKILLTILEKFNGGPVGLETLAAAVNEEKDTIEDVYEPFLIQEGLLDRTPRGRKITLLAMEHLGKKARGSPGKIILRIECKKRKSPYG